MAAKTGQSKGTPARAPRALTTPDLVILSLLAERPMHGYQANATLEARDVRSWAGVSRPQVYYSIEKLTRLELIRVAAGEQPSAGPERHVFETTELGRRRLSQALEHKRWSTGRALQPFLTWLALSWQASPRVFRGQLERRRRYLTSELERERATLGDVLAEVGHEAHEAVWMLKLVIEQLGAELKWLARVEREAEDRAPARRPSYPAPA